MLPVEKIASSMGNLLYYVEVVGVPLVIAILLRLKRHYHSSARSARRWARSSASCSKE